MKKQILLIFIICIIPPFASAFYTPPSATNIPLILNPSYSPPDYTNITLVLGDLPTDICTPPAINNNWNVLWRDNCTASSDTDLGTGALNLYGLVGGSFTFSADLYCSDLWMTKPASGTGTIINFQRIKIR